MLIVSEVAEAYQATNTCKGEKKEWLEYPAERFAILYREKVKGTFDEEIADVCIRLLDTMAFIKINIDALWDSVHIVNNYEYKLMDIVSELSECLELDRAGKDFKLNLIHAFKYAYFGFMAKTNVSLHIQLKMKYNASREALHGKKY